LKRIILIIALLLPLTANAGGLMMSSGTVSVISAGNCSSEAYSDGWSDTTEDNYPINSTAKTYMASRLVVGGSSISPCAVVVKYLYKSGTPAGTIHSYIYDDSVGAPGSLVTSGTGSTISANALPSSAATQRFTWGTTPTLSASTTYYIVLYVDDWDADSATNHYDIGYANTGITDGGFWRSTDGASWTNESGGVRIPIMVYE